MKRIERALRQAIEDLNDLGRRFALMGGFAVSARAEPRTTKDVDFAVAVEDDRDAEQLAFQLSQKGYVVHTTVEHTTTNRLATIRTMSPSGAIVDLLFASSGIENEIIQSATHVEILSDLRVPVATTGHLLACKVLARDDRFRPQDRVDLRALLVLASRRDLEEARAALELITMRGYARGRDLGAALDSAIADLT